MLAAMKAPSLFLIIPPHEAATEFARSDPLMLILSNVVEEAAKPPMSSQHLELHVLLSSGDSGYNHNPLPT